MSDSVNANTSGSVSDSLLDSPPSRAPADQGSGSRELGNKGSGSSRSNSPSIQRRVPAREPAATMDGQTDLPLDRLRDAEQAMTPGPWWGGTNNRRKNGIGLVSVGGNREAAPIAVLAGARQTIADRGANTVGIVLLRNHAAALIAAAVGAERARLLHSRDERPDNDHFYCDPHDCDRAGEGQIVGVCRTCEELYPCATRRALDGTP